MKTMHLASRDSWSNENDEKTEPFRLGFSLMLLMFREKFVFLLIEFLLGKNAHVEQFFEFG